MHRVWLNPVAVWELLDRLDISQNQLARRAGISTGHISLLMKGKRSPSPGVRRRLMKALGVDDRQLLRWRRGSCPSGGSMLSLIRLASQLPGGLNELLGHDPCAARREERSR